MPKDGEKEPTFQERLDTAREDLEGIGNQRAYEPDRLLESHAGALALIDEGVKAGEIEQEASIELKLSLTGAAKAVAKKKGDSAAEGTFTTFEDTLKVMKDLAKSQSKSGAKKGRRPRKQQPARTSAAKSGKPKSKQDT